MSNLKSYKIEDIRQCLEYIGVMLKHLGIPSEHVTFEQGRTVGSCRIICQVSLRETTIMVVKYDGYQDSFHLIIQ